MMIPYHDFFIGRIYTIVKKTEREDFEFENCARLWHGFVLFTEGSGVFTDENHEQYPISAGDILLLGRGNHYWIRATEKCSYITSALDISFDDLDEARLFPQILHLEEEMIQQFENALALYYDRGENALVQCRILLTSLYVTLFQRTQSLSQEKKREAERAARILKKTFRQNLSVSEIANQCNVSASYLRAIFARAYGMSITRYRERLRIEEAEILIRCGIFSLREISEQLGYCDVFHFTKNFTRAKGISPSKYREQDLTED